MTNPSIAVTERRNGHKRHLGTILAIDDTPANLDLLMSMLVKRGYRVRPALTGEAALISAQQSPPDLILLDVNMPGMNGYEVCERLKADYRTTNIPVIFVSALDETMDKVRAFQVGGVDYVTKPFQVEEVLARIESQLTLYTQRRALEQQHQELEDLRAKELQYFNDMNRIKDEFVRTVSHDLKNPITAIQGFIYLLRQSGRIVHPEDQHLLRRIEEGAEGMRSLVLDLLDLARLEAGMALKLEELRWLEFVQFNVDTFFSAAEQNVSSWS
ncbi:MAG: response regulator [Anaerolineae bacterium]|nr:response regulator [Anaerolineae bacterium]